MPIEKAGTMRFTMEFINGDPLWNELELKELEGVELEFEDILRKVNNYFKGNNMEKCKNCGRVKGAHRFDTLACPVFPTREQWSKNLFFSADTPKPYLDGVKVGDPLYTRDGEICEVCSLSALYVHIKLGDRTFVLTYEGALNGFENFGTIVFWKQPPQFTLPEKPKKKRKAWRWVLHERNDAYIISKRFATAEECLCAHRGCMIISRIEESMKEVDE